MGQDKYTWEEVNNKFKIFQERFENNTSDPTLLHMFDDFAKVVINSEFNMHQIIQISDKIKNLRKLFAQKQEELVQKSVRAVSKSKQVTTYIKNANYK